MKKWALVLAGGGGKGLVQIGVLKALEELGLKPNFVAGTSIGAMIGAAYCAGTTPDELRDFAESAKLSDYLDLFQMQIPVLDGISKAIQMPFMLKGFFGDLGLDSGERVEPMISELIKGKEFDQLEIPFICNAVDIVSNQHQIFMENSEVPLVDAIRASMSLPGFFVPKRIGDALFVDGGLFDNLLVEPTREFGYKNVLSISMDPEEQTDVDEFKNTLDVLTASMMFHSKANREKSKLMSSLNLNLWLGGSVADFGNVKEKCDAGYNMVMMNRKRLVELFK